MSCIPLVPLVLLKNTSRPKFESLMAQQKFVVPKFVDYRTRFGHLFLLCPLEKYPEVSEPLFKAIQSLANPPQHLNF